MKKQRNAQQQPRRSDWVWVGFWIGHIQGDERPESGTFVTRQKVVSLILDRRVPYYDIARFLNYQFKLPPSVIEGPGRTFEARLFVDEMIVLPPRESNYREAYLADLKQRGIKPSAEEVLRHIDNAAIVYKTIKNLKS